MRTTLLAALLIPAFSVLAADPAKGLPAPGDDLLRGYFRDEVRQIAANCFADIRSPLPEFMRAKAPEPPPLAAPPAVKTMLREKLDAVFTQTSRPTQVRVSEPRPNLRGPGWTACVRAEVISVIGKPLGTDTYRITISRGAIVDRRRADADDNCGSESYEPI